MNRDELFEGMCDADNSAKNRMLGRLFGLFETREDRGISVSSDEFFQIVEQWIEREEGN